MSLWINLYFNDIYTNTLDYVTAISGGAKDSHLKLLILLHSDDGPTVVDNHSPSRPDDGLSIIERKFILKNHSELVSAK